MKVQISWQKNLFDNVEVDTSLPPALFKMQLYSLTGVPPERQKIVVKGGLLKDDSDWNKLKIKEGQRLMMMGSAEPVPEPMDEEAEEEEGRQVDMDEAESEYGLGLTNLGNTCYMNSTMQCLYSVDELKKSLQRYTPSGSTLQDGGATITTATRDLFDKLDKSTISVAPIQFLAALRAMYPQFAQQGAGGIYMQQDAEECFSQILHALKGKLDTSETDVKCIESLFGIELETKLKCEESAEEVQEKQTVYTIKCNISQEVNHLNEGLKLALTEDREKNSESLGRMAIFKGNSSISSLPSYLTVQLVRFLYRRDTQQKAKILRRVAFPMRLDVFEFCTEELKQKMQARREVWQKLEDAKVEAKKSGKEIAPAENAEEDPEKFHTGFFDLHAIVTHKGRNADSGHYVSWVKQKNGEWVEFDDDQVIPVAEEDIQKLTGGGDWHMAYICIYKAHSV